MATAISKLLAEMQERLLVCEVCMEDFQSPQRLPRVLPCHHAFCGGCLQRLCKDNHIDCPLCRRPFVVEGPFPVETTRMTLLDLKKITGDQEDQECEGCSKKAKVTARCLECKESLCEDCCQAHKVVKATRKHTLMSLAEAAIDPSKPLKLTEECGKHEEKKLKFYCSECRQPACSSCAVLSHSGHKMVELEEIVKQKREELQAECQKLEAAIPHFKERVKSSAASVEMLDNRRSEISDKVREFFSKAKRLLSDKEEQILADFEAEVKRDRKALEAQQASDEFLLSEAQASLEFGQRVTAVGLPTQVLSAPQEMAKTSDDLKERGSTPAVPLPVYEMDGSLDGQTDVVGKKGIISQTGTLVRVEVKKSNQAPRQNLGVYDGKSQKLKNDWELERSDLVFEKKLSAGQFGEVWKGKWKGEKNVAIKTQKKGSMSVESFLVQTQIMKSCQHKHLVCLFGVCSKEEPIYIVTELMTNGSLLKYLREGAGHTASVEVLIDMAGQVASGMAFLGEKRIIHRDPTARNVLVGENNVVKVAGFGLAKILAEGDDEYSPDNPDGKWPLKWMAPEAIEHWKFTIKSDVWSYGILLNELMTRGQPPYPGMKTPEVIAQMTNGYRMPRPKECPEPVYQIMLKCWDDEPNNRPTFEYLCSYFENH